MPKAKPDGWKEDLEMFVREGKNYKDCVAALTEKYGSDDGKIGVSTFGKLKKLAFPDEKAEEAIESVNETHRKGNKKKIYPAWTPQKQKAGDESQLAKVLNEVAFLAIPCPSQELKLADVQEINVGGGIVNTVQYAFPQIDLHNPVLILALRVGLLLVKVKKLCYDIKAKLKTGINPEYQKDVSEVTEIPDVFGEHPTDVYMKKHGLFEDEDEKGK